MKLLVLKRQFANLFVIQDGKPIIKNWSVQFLVN